MLNLAAMIGEFISSFITIIHVGDRCITLEIIANMDGTK
jgi:hypothetical protein